MSWIYIIKYLKNIFLSYGLSPAMDWHHMLFGTNVGMSISVTLGHCLQELGEPSRSPVFICQSHIGHLKPISRNCFYYCLMSGLQRAHDDITYHLTSISILPARYLSRLRGLKPSCSQCYCQSFDLGIGTVTTIGKWPVVTQKVWLACLAIALVALRISLESS